MLKRFGCMDVPDCVSGDGGYVTVISGLPRSGTSMMMRALLCAGMPVLTDNVRRQDDRNPHGYFEWEAVKNRDGYQAWMAQARGRAVKLVSRFLPHLPATHGYRVVFMHRQLEAVIRSQGDMARHHSGQEWNEEEGQALFRLYAEHVPNVLRWVRSRPNMRLLEVDYDQVLHDPLGSFGAVARFLAPTSLDVGAMAATVDAGLNHQAMEMRAHG
ncbi:sulfotransferase domain-containing protein [Pseudomonas sp. RHF3.3-3]|uniref:sulfotransferase domain-containing protein n=1 Tax=Pseudomonas sp. RHF3.3-3 TaxID=3396624 RepID=UPI003A8424FB